MTNEDDPVPEELFAVPIPDASPRSIREAIARLVGTLSCPACHEQMMDHTYENGQLRIWCIACGVEGETETTVLVPPPA